LREAHALLTPLLGAGLASSLFAIALLCSGQSATITGTLAGQVVMEGFLQLRISPLLRRAITRLLAVTPAIAVLAIAGEDQTVALLVGTQVVLSLQLPFAIVPLVRFTSRYEVMGRFANRMVTKILGWSCVAFIIAANGWLVLRNLHEWRGEMWFHALLAAYVALLLYIAFVPLARGGSSSTFMRLDNPNGVSYDSI
jgi:manganese transport protein